MPSLVYGGGGVFLKGVVTDPYDRRIPGCLVSVASTTFRSRPVFTNSAGYFEVVIPLVEGQSSELNQPPLLEIYWNEEVLFRQPLIALHPVSADADWQHLLIEGGSVDLGSIRVGRR